MEVNITNDIITPVVCRRYGMLFPHDFSGKGPLDYEIVKKKYDRRIQRLNDVMIKPVLKNLVFNRGTLNDWQLDQYRLAGMVFEDNYKDKLELFSKKRSAMDIKILSLSSIKTANMNMAKSRVAPRITNIENF